MFLKGAHICEKSKGSADEYSGSSDEQNDNKDVKDFDHTICIEVSFALPYSLFLHISFCYVVLPFWLLLNVFEGNSHW